MLAFLFFGDQSWTSWQSTVRLLRSRNLEINSYVRPCGVTLLKQEYAFPQVVLAYFPSNITTSKQSRPKNVMTVQNSNYKWIIQTRKTGYSKLRHLLGWLQDLIITVIKDTRNTKDIWCGQHLTWQLSDISISMASIRSS